MGRFAIVAYTPKAGMESQTLSVVWKHHDILRAHKLVTDRPAYVMRAAQGAVLEVFEWRSPESVEQAHRTPAVQALWEEFAAVCDFSPLSTLQEAGNMFAEFDSLERLST